MKTSLVVGGLLLSLTTVAHAHTAPFPASGCHPLGAYHVTGVSAQELPVQEAITMLFTGTPWRVQIDGALPNTKLSYNSVSGPLDQVLARAVEQAGKSQAAPLVAVSDPSRCLVTLSLPVNTAVDTATHGGVLPAGESLSAALERYAEQNGWKLRWNIDDDYVLDVDLPLPADSLVNTITWVVNTYQSQGGLHGVAPRFAHTNRVVVIEHMNVREAN